jgi:hypothetical protein
MNRQAYIAAGLTGTIVIGLVTMAWMKERPDSLFETNQPVTEAQFLEKLRAKGYADISIERDRYYFKATAKKDGRDIMVAIDSRDGQLANHWVEDND